MIINSLHLRNYKQYGHLDLEFREGLVGIIGRNGAGKSTIFEAILYCLFGRDDSNKVHIRSAFADAKSTVELVLKMSIGEIQYRVVREFRGKTLTTNAELYKNDLQIAKGVSAVNDEIGRVLNMERDTFKRSVFSGQKELSELSDTSGEARKRMVRKMLGLDTLDGAQSKVNTDLRDLHSQIAGQQQNLLTDPEVSALETEIEARDLAGKTNLLELEKAQAHLATIEAQYRTEKQRFDAEEQKLAQYNALNSTLGQLKERQDGLIQQIEQLDKKSAELAEQRIQLEAQRSEFITYESEKKELVRLEAARQRHVNFETYTAKINDLQEPLANSRAVLHDLTQKLVAQNANALALQANKTANEQIEGTIEAKRAEYQELSKKISSLEERIRDRREKLEGLQQIGKGGTCPTCFQPVLESYDGVLAQLAREIDTIQTNELQTLIIQQQTVTQQGIDLKAQQTELRRAREKLLQEQSRLQEFAKQMHTETVNLQRLEASLTQHNLILREIGTVQFDATQYQVVTDRIALLEPRYLAFGKEENYIIREAPAVERSRQKAAAERTAAQTAIAEKTAQIANIDQDPARYLAAKQALTSFDETLSRQSAEVRSLERTGLELQNEIAQRRQRLQAHARIRAQVSDKLQEVELLKKVAEMLGTFKTEILEKVSPGISKEASDLFSRITKGKYEGILVDENFDFTIADGGQYYPIDRFSGGEIDLANFCLRIAITKAIMELSGSQHRLEFLAFDEIFGSQDEDRRHEMMLALNYLQEQFRQIYLVSHIESLKDYFPNILEVKYAAEGSTAGWI